MTLFTAHKTHLSVLAERAGAVVPSKGQQAAVLNLRVEAEDGLLRITGTDMELTVVASTPAVKVAEPGIMLFPAARFLEVLREAPPGPVSVGRLEGSRGNVVAGGVSWTLRLFDGSFPEIPDFTGVQFTSVKRAELVSAIRTVRHAASKNGTSPAYACVTILPDSQPDAEGRYRTKVVACDMARVQQAEIAQRESAPGFPFAASIPAAGSPTAVAEVLRLLNANEELAEAEVAETAHALAFRAGSGTIYVRKLASRPANTQDLMRRAETNCTQSFTVARDALREAVRRVRITADRNTPVIGLRLRKGQLIVLSRDTLSNNSSQALESDWDGAERLLLVTHTHLTDMLDVHPSAECRFLIAPESDKRRKSVLMLRDPESGVTGVIPQMAAEAVRLGYE